MVGDGSDEPVEARAVIVATGSTPRRLGIPGEERLLGRGISHRASCDGPIYRERAVAVIGCGDSALLETLEVAEHVASVTVFVRGGALRGQHTYVGRVEAAEKATLVYDTVVEEILGEDAVSGVRTRNVATGETARSRSRRSSLHWQRAANLTGRATRRTRPGRTGADRRLDADGAEGPLRRRRGAERVGGAGRPSRGTAPRPRSPPPGTS